MYGPTIGSLRRAPHMADATLGADRMNSENRDVDDATDWESIDTQLFEQAIGAGYDDLLALAPRYVFGKRLFRGGFERRLKSRWGRALYLYDLFVVTARQYGSDFNARHRAQAVEGQDYVFEVLTRTHGRACFI